MIKSGFRSNVASRSLKTPVIVLNGVSKIYFAPGWRVGYMALHDPSGNLNLVRDGMERLLRSRLCASTPAQYGFLAGLNGDSKWLDEHKSKIKNRKNKNKKYKSKSKKVNRNNNLKKLESNYNKNNRNVQNNNKKQLK